ncbi:hypothetical protein GN244_ATG06887 [Phytophthora infestans]|uniref:Uncharacterized protein n=1 Tax=Phytophthora infestans TaxID=4787 RepID=A0A833T713_PHYIN|nr:hypothetical protein GN244_ATG06887 [Phytophthora infestans]
MKVLASQMKRCSVCKANYDEHLMRYRIYGCGSDPCLDSGATCSFKLKTVSCETSQLCHFYQLEHHVSSGGQSTRPKLSREVKATIQDLVLQDVKPARIRNELIDRLTLTADTQPALK